MPKISSIIFPHDFPAQISLKIYSLAMEKLHLDSALKPDTSVHAQAIDDGDNGFLAQPEYGSKYDPAHDKRDMFRLGRKQELKRRFRYCEATPPQRSSVIEDS